MHLTNLNSKLNFKSLFFFFGHVFFPILLPISAGIQTNSYNYLINT